MHPLELELRQALRKKNVSCDQVEEEIRNLVSRKKWSIVKLNIYQLTETSRTLNITLINPEGLPYPEFACLETLKAQEPKIRDSGFLSRAELDLPLPPKKDES